MAFQYTPFVNPYAASIGDLLAHQNDARAHAAEVIGAAQAHAAEAKGQAYAGAIQQVGQTVAAIPQQIQQQKTQALQQENIQSEIDDRAAQAKLRDAQMAAQQRDQQAQSAWADAIKSSIGPDGKPDLEQAANKIMPMFPVQATAYLEAAQKTKATGQQLTEGQQKIQDGQRQVQQAAVNHMGELAAVGLEKIRTGATPLDVRDTTIGLVANAASHGLVSENDSQQFLLQSAQATPEQLGQVFQKFLDQAPDVKTRLVAEDLKKSETAKNTAEAAKANSEAGTAGKPTEAQMDATAQALMTKRNLGQPLTPEESASLKAYEQRRTIPTDASAAATAANQRRAQDFNELQAARGDIEKNVNTPYLTARGSANTLRDVVTAAQNGNEVAASLQSLETTMSAIRAAGLNRINKTETDMSGNAGSLFDNIEGYIGKKLEGQPVPADIQKDMLRFADILENAAYKKYLAGHKASTDLYGVTDKLKPSLAAPDAYAPPPPVPLTPGLQSLKDRK